MQTLTARSNCLISDLAKQTYLAMSAFEAPFSNLLRHPARDCFLIPFCMTNTKQAGLQCMVRQCAWMHPYVTEVAHAIAGHQSRGPKPVARK